MLLYHLLRKRKSYLITTSLSLYRSWWRKSFFAAYSHILWRKRCCNKSQGFLIRSRLLRSRGRVPYLVLPYSYELNMLYCMPATILSGKNTFYSHIWGIGYLIAAILIAYLRGRTPSHRSGQFRRRYSSLFLY